MYPRCAEGMLILVLPPPSLEERLHTNCPMGIAMTTGRIRVVRLESISDNFLVSVWEARAMHMRIIHQLWVTGGWLPVYVYFFLYSVYTRSLLKWSISKRLSCKPFLYVHTLHSKVCFEFRKRQLSMLPPTSRPLSATYSLIRFFKFFFILKG